jgi:hypothetical protein
MLRVEETAHFIGTTSAAMKCPPASRRRILAQRNNGQTALQIAERSCYIPPSPEAQP